jgi:hypothetical protein
MGLLEWFLLQLPLLIKAVEKVVQAVELFLV